MIKILQNQNYYDNGPYVAKIGPAVAKLMNKLERVCSKQRSDIVLNAIGNLLVLEIAHCFDANQHQEIINLLARNIAEGLQRYLGNEKMFDTSGELTNSREINKHMN